MTRPRLLLTVDVRRVGPHPTHGTYGLLESSPQTASRSVQPFLYGSQMLRPKCYAVQCIVNGGENSPSQRKEQYLGPKYCPLRWDFVTLPGEDVATAIGNMHIKIGKDRACGSGDMLADRQTDRHTVTQTDVIITIFR